MQRSNSSQSGKVVRGQCSEMAFLRYAIRPALSGATDAISEKSVLSIAASYYPSGDGTVVHIHHDLDILKYHRHFPLSQSPLNLYTALKNLPLQKTRLLTERESEKKMPNHAWLPSARTKPPLWKCANFIAIYGWSVANSPGYGTGRSKGRFSGERSGAVPLFLFIFTDDSF